MAAAVLALTIAPLSAQDSRSSPARGELNTLQDLWAALGACWLQPPRAQARPGTEITVRFSLNRAGSLIGEPRITYSTRSLPDEVKSAYQQSIHATLRRCTPLRLSSGFAGAIAGRPASVRFIDDRDE